MFDHDDGIPQLGQPIEHLQELADVVKVKAGCRFVQQIERPSCLTLAELAGELDALSFAARKRGR